MTLKNYIKKHFPNIYSGLRSVRDALLFIRIWASPVFPITYSDSAAFHGDNRWRNKVIALLQKYDFDCIVETGTYKGSTTLFFREHSNLPIFTSEVRRLYAYESSKRFKGRGIVQHLTDSPNSIHEIAKKYKFPLIFLDAHWYEQNPLAAEMKEVQAFDRAVVMVDDFDLENGISTYYDDMRTIKPFISGWKVEFPDYVPVDGYVILYKNL